MDRSEWRVVGYTGLAHGLVHALELSFAALLLRIEAQFGVDKLFLGVVATGFAIAFGATAVPAGMLSDRLGSKRTLSILLLLTAIAAMLVGLSLDRVTFVGALLLLGLATGLYHPTGIALIAHSVRQRARAIGFHGVAGNLGIAAAPLLAGLVATVSWRLSYFVLALLALGLSLLVHVSRLPTLSEQEQARETAAAAGAIPQRTNLVPLLLVYLVSMLSIFIYRGTLTFLPAHIEERLHIAVLGRSGTEVAGSLTALVLLMGAVGQYTGGTLSSRFRHESLGLVLIALVMPMLILVGMTTELLLLGAVGAFVFFQFAAQPIFTSLVASYTAAGAIGRSYGITFLTSFVFASVATTPSGWLADRWGTAAVFYLMAAVAVLSLLTAGTIWRLALARSRAAAVVAALEGR